MSNGHELFATWSGAYTLGALEGTDRRAFEDHMSTCPICTADVASFAPLPGLLSQIDSADVRARPDTVSAARIEAKAKDQIVRMRRSARRWKTAAVVAAAAVVLIAVVAFRPGRQDPPAFAATINSSLSQSAKIGMNPKPWGTEITVELSGLPSRDSYELWVVDDGGVWISTATWSPTPTGLAALTGATSTPFTKVDRIVVTSSSQTDILIDASTSTD